MYVDVHMYIYIYIYISQAVQNDAAERSSGPGGLEVAAYTLKI